MIYYIEGHLHSKMNVAPFKLNTFFPVREF